MNGERPPEAMAPPAVPLTLEGSAILHQMFRVRWAAWRALDAHTRLRAADEAARLFTAMERPEQGQSALFSMLGHKGDLMIVHFRNTFHELNEAELCLSRLALADCLEPAH